MEIEGINIVKNARSEIEMGIHKDTFINYLNSLSTNQAGYINIILIPNFKPTRKGGYTHYAKLVTDKEEFPLNNSNGTKKNL